MTPESAVQIIRDMFMTAFWIAAPLLAVCFAVGIIVSLIQIVTSIQDSGFNAIPRLVAFLAAAIFIMPWMLKQMTTYTTGILGNLARYAK